MGVLQDFERRLEGAVEGFFARAFRSGLQPIELAKALQRYAGDTQHVTEDGVVVPNVYRIRVNPKDHERLDSFGASLTRELAGVVARTADERGWQLRGPALVRLQRSDEIKYGMYEVQGRVEEVEGAQALASTGGAPTPAGGPGRTAEHPAPQAEPRPLRLRPTGRLRHDDGRTTELTGSRLSVGRLPSCDVTLEDNTVSREHAALVRRGDQWWALDLGSTNGTAVNEVVAAEHPLRPGDRIGFGEVVLTFEEG